MNVPMRGSRLRAEAEFLVACRRFWRVMRPEIPSMLWAGLFFWMGLLIGGIAGWLRI